MDLCQKYKTSISLVKRQIARNLSANNTWYLSLDYTKGFKYGSGWGVSVKLRVPKMVHYMENPTTLIIGMDADSLYISGVRKVESWNRGQNDPSMISKFRIRTINLTPKGLKDGIIPLHKIEIKEGTYRRLTNFSDYWRDRRTRVVGKNLIDVFGLENYKYDVSSYDISGYIDIEEI